MPFDLHPQHWKPLFGFLSFGLAACLLFGLATWGGIFLAVKGRRQASGDNFLAIPKDDVTDVAPTVAERGMTPASSPVEVIDELRGVIRAILFAIHANKDSEGGVSSLAFTSIFKLGWAKLALPEKAPAEAHRLLASITSQIDDLRHRLENGASQSVILELLIEMNANARELSAALSPRQSH